MDILGILANDDEAPVLYPRIIGTVPHDVTNPPPIEPWEWFVYQLQRVSLRPVALRIKQWLPDENAPLWEIITPDIELADATRHFTPPVARGRGTTARAAVEDYMAFVASAFEHRSVLAVYCRDHEDKKNSKWVFYKWTGQEFAECERPTPDPEPIDAPML